MLDVSTFAYDTAAPVELTVLSEQGKDGVSIQDVSFKSPLSGRVSAYLIVPPEPQPRAGLIFGHWGEGNRGEGNRGERLFAVYHGFFALALARICLDRLI